MAGLLPDGIAPEAIDRRIAACFIGAQRLCRPNGSMEEAFPYESSFCVTALVAYDLLTSIEVQGELLNPQERNRRLQIVAPLIHFLHQVDEHHAFISNHLATAAVALYKWHALTQDGGEQRGRLILDRILQHQSAEGWYEEYGGADPGYQSLCTYYLADLHRLRPDLDLGPSLHRSLRFVWHFAHPDGSFGGVYGSRHTRFFYPAGIEYLAAECLEANVLAAFMRCSVVNQNTVTLRVMDAPNLIPMFNAYAWGATLFDRQAELTPDTSLKLPGLAENYSAGFPEAGLYVHGNAAGYTVVSTAKGGALLYSDRTTGQLKVNGGVVAQDPKGNYYSTQALSHDRSLEVKADRIVVTSAFYPMRHQRPTSLKFIVLRLMNLTVMRSMWLGNLVKQLLVRLLITGGRPLKSRVRRTIMWNTNGPKITDEWLLAKSEQLTPVDVGGDFSAIHMASKGYWQRQDDTL
jgi:hypothetical protein